MLNKCVLGNSRGWKIYIVSVQIDTEEPCLVRNNGISILFFIVTVLKLVRDNVHANEKLKEMVPGSEQKEMVLRISEGSSHALNKAINK